MPCIAHAQCISHLCLFCEVAFKDRGRKTRTHYRISHKHTLISDSPAIGIPPPCASHSRTDTYGESRSAIPTRTSELLHRTKRTSGPSAEGPLVLDNIGLVFRWEHHGDNRLTFIPVMKDSFERFSSRSGIIVLDM